MKWNRRVAIALPVLAILVAGAVYLVLRSRERVVTPLPPERDVPRLESALEGQRTAATTVAVRYLPEAERIEGYAQLEVEVTGKPRSTFHFLLNPAFDIRDAHVDGQGATAARDGPTVTLHAPEAVESNIRTTIEIEYEAAVSASFGPGVRISAGHLAFPLQSCWYPSDFRSFSAFRCRVTLPRDMTVPVAGAVVEDTIENGLHAIEWEEPRPVIGAALVAGRYDRIRRLCSGTVCTAFWPTGATVDAAPLLETAGAAHNYFTSLYGDDGFRSVALVAYPGAERAFNGGNAVIALDPSVYESDLDRFRTIAHQVARNWWGGTVSGRWLSDRPEGGDWLVNGLAEYSAWLFLREQYGRRAYLRCLEQRRCPPTIPWPMKQFGLTGSDLATPESQPFRDVRQPFVAAMATNLIGADAFQSGCANFFEIHRYTTVS